MDLRLDRLSRFRQQHGKKDKVVVQKTPCQKAVPLSQRPAQAAVHRLIIVKLPAPQF